MLINKNHLVLSSTAQTMKNVVYDIPIDAKADSKASSCGVEKDILIVNWTIGNSFELVFDRNNKTYDLSSFTITLDVSNIFNDSAGS